ncbi:MAG: hypothetical protein COV47_01685 [Candidatus Diapherotrites archaeon CG11_big_fil_rev_8_21_14_0_20_37_9]|nr:MAG: hypothetical protein COV47_01685 [Candidatus Diapherotrites archaeon CG11_big_fil_rev_8_21_14_0_20_37_9]
MIISRLFLKEVTKEKIVLQKNFCRGEINLNKNISALLLAVLFITGLAFAADPTVSVTSPGSGSYLKDGSHSIAFTVTDADAPMDVNADIYYSTTAGGLQNLIKADLNLLAGSCTTTDFSTGATCTYTWSLSGVSDGNYFIDVKARDLSNADNATGSGDSFMIDNALPTITIYRPQDGNTSYTSTLVSFDVNRNGSPVNKSSIAVTLVGNSSSFSNSSCTQTNGNYHCEYNESNITISGTAYTIRVNASDFAGNAAAQADSDFTFLDSDVPGKVTGLTATSGDVQIVLSWTAVSAADLNAYFVYMSTSSGFTPDGSTYIGTTTSTSFTKTGLSNGTTYYFKVRSNDTSGNFGETSDQVNAQPQAASSGAPTGTPTISSETHNEDDWKESDDPEFTWSSVSNADNYRYALNTTDNYVIDSDDESTTSRGKNYSHIDDGERWFHVAACNSNGCGPTDHFRIRVDNTGPEVPANVFGLSQSNSSIYLSWDEPDDQPDNGNSGVDYYIIYRNIRDKVNNRDFVASDPGVREFTNITKTNYTDKDGLTQGIAYYYKVQAVDKAGNKGALSSIKRVLNSGNACGVAINITVEEPASEGSAEILVTVAGGDLLNGKVKAKLPDGAYATLVSGKNGTEIKTSFDIPANISGKGAVLVEGKDENDKACDELLEFDIDSVKPTISGVTPSEGAIVKDKATISASVNDDGTGIAFVEAFINDASIGRLEQKNGTYSFEWNSNSKANGSYSLKIVATDNAGNEASRLFTIKVNNIDETLFAAETYVYDISKLEQLLKNAGVTDKAMAEAIRLTNSNQPTRELEIRRVASGLEAKIKISFVNNEAKNSIQIVEVIPKGVVQSASAITSDKTFIVLQSDPAIKFDLGSVDAGQEIVFEYAVGKALTEEEGNRIQREFQSFAAPPIILESNPANPIQFSPIPDSVWIVFVIVILIIMALIIMLLFGGGAFLAHKMIKKRNAEKGLGKFAYRGK